MKKLVIITLLIVGSFNAASAGQDTGTLIGRKMLDSSGINSASKDFITGELVAIASVDASNEHIRKQYEYTGFNADGTLRKTRDYPVNNDYQIARYAGPVDNEADMHMVEIRDPSTQMIITKSLPVDLIFKIQ